MSALLGKYKHVEMYFPGGCKIGARPIDQTLKAFEALGAIVEEDDNKYIIDAEELKGTTIYLDMPSVGATINTILVACRAKGTTILRNAAKEPEIVNVETFLNQLGAKITGAGTSEIKIEGVDSLTSGFTEVIPDRIEAGTYVILGALAGNNLKINNIIPDHIESLISKLNEMGIPMKIDNSSITISKSKKKNPVAITTLGYPGFATDLQQPVTTLLTQCQGISILTETIYENRFQNVEYLNKMGANIIIKDKTIEIYGPTQLKGCEVKATDLRAGACLVLAALIAEGTTTITDVEHILRGYENIVEKLTNVGAKITLE
jgi:UDP-N-acetylglucosamine 1-carboxyvinyltransferase